MSHDDFRKETKGNFFAIKPRPVPDKRFSRLQLDIVGPMPESEGKKYLLTILDTTTRWLEAVPLAEATSTACAKAFIERWVPHFGLPSDAGSDNGKNFQSIKMSPHMTYGSI